MQLEAGSKTLRAHKKVNCCGLSLLLFYVLEGRAMVSFRPSQEKKSFQVSGELEVFRPSRDTPILLISVLYVLPRIRLHPYTHGSSCARFYSWPCACIQTYFRKTSISVNRRC